MNIIKNDDNKIFDRYMNRLRHDSYKSTLRVINAHKKVYNNKNNNNNNKWWKTYLHHDLKYPSRALFEADNVWRDVIKSKCNCSLNINEHDALLETIEQHLYKLFSLNSHPLSRIIRKYAKLFQLPNRSYGTIIEQQHNKNSSTQQATCKLDEVRKDIKQFTKHLIRLILRIFFENIYDDFEHYVILISQKVVNDAIFSHKSVYKNIFPLYKRKNYYRDARFAAKLVEYQHITTKDLITNEFMLIEHKDDCENNDNNNAKIIFFTDNMPKPIKNTNTTKQFRLSLIQSPKTRALKKRLINTPKKQNIPKLSLSSTEDPYEEAIQYFRQISQMYTPKDKLICLVNASEAICNCVDRHYKNNNTQQASFHIGGDDLLSIFSYIVIKSKLVFAMSEAEFINDFICEKDRTTQQGYLLATFQACLELIDSEELSK